MRRLFTALVAIMCTGIVCYALSVSLPEIKSFIKKVFKCIFSFKVTPYKSIATQEQEDQLATKAADEKKQQQWYEKKFFIVSMSDREKKAYLYGIEDGFESGYEGGRATGYRHGYILGCSSNKR